MSCLKPAIAVVLAGALTSGCGGYAPLPLDGSRADAVLSAPDRRMLEQQATQLHHPRIAPITLDFSRPLTGDELAVIAVLVNPDLKALRAKEGVAEAQVFDAGLLPDPQLALGLDFPTSSQPDLVNAYNLGLTWDILGLVTRRATRRVAQARQVQVRNDIAWSEWMTANQARLLARRVVYLGAQQDLAQSAAETASRLLDISKRNLERHDIKIDEFALREVAYLDALDKALALSRELEKARQDLNKDLGLLPSERVSIALERTPDETSLDTQALFDIARNQRLDLIALRAGYQAEENQLQRDLLARFPQINLGLQRARDTGNVTTLGFSIGITLPIFNGGRGTIAISRATREQLRAEYVARLYQTRSDIATLVADLERIDRELEPLVSQLATLQHAEETMRRGVASGDVTLINYETVRANLLDKQLKLSSLEQARAEQQVALQLATGAPWHT
ncbi:MAG: TolC family protein [Betaproteobacteria bacterium]